MVLCGCMRMVSKLPPSWQSFLCWCVLPYLEKKNPGHPLEKRGWGMPGIQKGWGLRGEQIWWEGRLQGWSGIRSLIWQGWEKIVRDHWATGKLYRQNLARWTRHLGCESALYRAMTAVDICVSPQEAHRALVHIFCDSNKGWAACGWESRVPLHRQVFRAITQRERRLAVWLWRGNQAKSLESNRKPVRAP